MQRSPWRRRRAPVAALVALALHAEAIPVAAAGVAATGWMGGERVATEVDSDVARALIEDGDEGRERLAAAARSALARADRLPLTVELGRQLTAELSLDAATVYLANRIAAEPANAALRARFDRTAEAMRRATPESPFRLAVPPAAVVAFVPGFGWRRDPTTGADFARQRALLAELGVVTHLVETREDGTVDENASIVAGALATLARHHERIYLVSTSKGGPEAALGLTRASPAALAKLESWLSVGGLLRGSPYADRFAGGVAHLFARVVFAFKGLAGGSVRDLSTAVRRPAMAGFRLPAGVRAIAWIGAPLSGQIADDVRGRWRAIAPHGPNDGLTLLVDELIPGGRAVVSPGLDHYYRDPEIDLKVAALTALLFEESSAANDAGAKP